VVARHCEGEEEVSLVLRPMVEGGSWRPAVTRRLSYRSVSKTTRVRVEPNGRKGKTHVRRRPSPGIGEVVTPQCDLGG
jgi:hypothetical protein